MVLCKSIIHIHIQRYSAKSTIELRIQVVLPTAAVRRRSWPRARAPFLTSPTFSSRRRSQYAGIPGSWSGGSEV